jgi:hypothetical protein
MPVPMKLIVSILQNQFKLSQYELLVISSLQKADSLLVLVNARYAKQLSEKLATSGLGFCMYSGFSC